MKGSPGRDVPPARRWLAYAVVALVTLVAYARVPGFDFVLVDDPEYVASNPKVLAGLSLDGLTWALTTFHKANWHPLTWVSLQLDATIGGRSPGVYHTTNLLLHVAAGWLLLAFLERATGARWRAVFVAAVFAIHPLHVESVAWIAERKDVLSAALGFSALLAYAAWTRGPTAGRYAAALGLYVLGLLAKPMLVTWPLVMLLLDVWPLRRTGTGARGSTDTPRRIGRLITEKLPFAALAAASCAITFVAQQHGEAVQSAQDYPYATRVANAAVSYVAYVGDALWPRGLAEPYPYDRARLTPVVVLASALVLAAATVAAVASVRRRPWVFAGWGWYMVTLVPVIGLVQVGAQARADRYTYIPLVGLAIIAAWGVPDLVSRWVAREGTRRRVLAGAGSVVVVVLAAATWRQTGYWSDARSHIGRALAVTERNALAFERQGSLLASQGRFAEAEESFEAAVAIDPGFFPALVNLSAARFRLGHYREAAESARDALKLRPDHPAARENLIAALVQGGSPAEAEAELRAALARAPDDAWVSRTLAALLVRKAGAMLARGGGAAAAEDVLREALRLDPSSVEARHNLAVVLAR